MKTLPLKTDFSSGEISPNMLGRVDSAEYQNGAIICENWIPKRQGTLSKREGSRFVRKFENAQNGRAFEFPVLVDSPYVVTITDDGFIRVNDRTGAVLGSLDTIVANPDFDTPPSSSDWVTEGTASWADGQLTLIEGPTGGNVPTGLVTQLIEFTADVEHLLFIEWASGSTNFPAPDTVVGRPRIDFGSTPFGTEYGAYAVFGSSGGGVPRTSSYVFKPSEFTGNNSLFPSTGIPVGIPVYVTLRETTFRAPQVQQYLRIDSANITPVSAISEVSFPHPWGAEEFQNLQVVVKPNSTEMIIVSGTKPPQTLSFDPVNETFDFEPTLFTSPPAEWTADNWPRSVTIFQARSWWGGTPLQPDTIWASRSNDYEDLSTSGTPSDDDGFNLVMAARSTIKWIDGTGQLLVGTDRGVFRLGNASDNNQVITAGNAIIDLQTSYGVSKAQPISIGNKLIHITAGQSKVRDVGFVNERRAWVSDDVTFAADHLYQNYGNFNELSYSQLPDSTVWVVTGSGILLSCTYEPESGVIGWARSRTDNGFYVSSAVAYYQGQPSLWTLVRRNIDGTNQLYLEEQNNGTYMDSSLTVTLETPSNIITGLDHLAGLPVQALINNEGVYGSDAVVQLDGTLELNTEVFEATVGLKISSSWAGTPYALPKDNGSSFASKKVWNRIGMRLLGARPSINNQQPDIRSSTDQMDQSPPFFVGDAEVSTLGHDQLGLIFFNQNEPLASTIIALYGEIDPRDL